jgi:hypothetical protein
MNEIPGPRTEFGVIKRYLHVLALLQNNKDPQDWNGNSLADLLSLDEAPDSPLGDKNIRDVIRKHLKDELGIEIETIKGGRRTELTGELEGELLRELLSLYSFFVVKDASRDVALNLLARKHPHDALWVMARLYFASLEQRVVEFDYTTNSGYRISRARFHPWHIVYRNNNLYLVGRLSAKEERWLIILNRVENLKILNEHFNDDVPPVEEIFKESLGSWIGEKKEVVIRFRKSLAPQIEQFLDVLEPDIREDGEEHLVARFTIADDIYLCKQLFLYGEKAEILEPESLRKTMKEMLEKSLGLYQER